MTPDSITFRQQHRTYGLRVPIDDVPAHLACGWRPVEDVEEMYCSDGRLLLKPPAVFGEGRTAIYLDGAATQ